MTAWILLNILVVFSISNCICGKNFRNLSCAGGEISRKQILKKFIKNFQTNKNHFWVLLIGFPYLSQNSSFKSKKLILYLEMFALQNGSIFIQIWKFDWARSGVVLVQWLLRRRRITQISSTFKANILPREKTTRVTQPSKDSFSQCIMAEIWNF